MESIKNILAQKNQPGDSLKTTTPTNRSDEKVDVCSICHDTGIVHPVGENGKLQYDRAVPCLCSRDRILKMRYERMLHHCWLPAGTDKWTFENFDASGPLQEAYEVALQFAEEKGDAKWLVLVGGVDVGKSHLAVSICRRWLARGKPARYVLVPQMLDELRSSYQYEGEYDKLMWFLSNVSLLVLDDLGAQRSTEWAIEKLTQIVDHRYVNAMPLVVTTNKPVEDIPGDAEGRIASRLLREDYGKVVYIKAPEYRTRRKS